jgi:G3E family GTPase
MASHGAIPVTIVGGYLGAGKTTLVNHLLRHSQGRRIAVLVNDFGELAIDAELIEARDGDMLQLAGGCVCCSFGSDLLAALLRLRDMQPAPRHILIETSGVALPGAVARTLTLVPPPSGVSPVSPSVTSGA